MRIVFVLVTFLAVTQSKNLPSYMNKCSRSDPKLNECIVSSANLALGQIIKGDKKYKIPSFEPLEVNQIVTEPGPNLKVVLNNVKSYGIEAVKLYSAKMDFDKNFLNIKNTIPKLTVMAQYDMKGRILVLPIEGNGNCNITYLNSKFDYDTYYEHYINKKDGKNYVQVVNYTMDIEPERTIYNFENLFNGDKRLGDQMNTFMNENWKELHKDMGGTVGQTMGTVTTSVLNAIFKQVPFDELFSP